MSNKYNPTINSREQAKHYISASNKDIQQMLEFIDNDDLTDLFKHIDQQILFKQDLGLEKSLTSTEIIDKVKKIADKNIVMPSFIADALNVCSTSEIVNYLLQLRQLTTSYTPYQPERSQGTLVSLWLFQCLISKLTGFEAINCSFYERSTAIFEAIRSAKKINKKKNDFIIFSSLFNQDIEVIKTHCKHTNTNLHFIDITSDGIINIKELELLCKELDNSLAAIVFPQINSLGLLEDVNEITDIAYNYNCLSIASVDISYLVNDGIKSPADFGKNGADIFVGEAQHLAIDANFGGPGLGIFGIRYNKNQKKHIRASSGRFVGRAKDVNGNDAFALILSTREQHIKREKANSNICSNQSYIATIFAGNLLNKGSEGLNNSINYVREQSKLVITELSKLEGITFPYKDRNFINEFIISTAFKCSDLIEKAIKDEQIIIGIDVSERIAEKGNFLKIAILDIHTKEEIQKLINFFKNNFSKKDYIEEIDFTISASLTQKRDIFIKKYTVDELKKYYLSLAEQNISPDSSIYPLGSCTMKYNPYLNDYTASFNQFQKIHPQVPTYVSQGCLEILFNIQEYFKEITALDEVITQAVAGAQGELVGLKLFQAYFEDRNEKRDIILIPNSAHGTNPATATTAGFNERFSDENGGILFINANQSGEIDLVELKNICQQYTNRIFGIMITNPNTSGLFETKIKIISKMIHDVGGLVYMDGANMNAIASWVNLKESGIDAVHNNLHKTWSIPHGGGGPGDAIVAVDKKLADYLPGYQVIKKDNSFCLVKKSKSIGQFHRHYGNFAHKVRCYTYLLALGSEGIKKMSAVAVLSSRYIYQHLKDYYKILPNIENEFIPMHEFIISLPDFLFEKIEKIGIKKSDIIGRLGKLFLDFGFHSPTVAFPEPLGLMIEPTESYTKQELDKFIDACICIYKLIQKYPQVLLTVPHFTPISLIDELQANLNPILSEELLELPKINSAIPANNLLEKSNQQITEMILEKHNNINKRR